MAQVFHPSTNTISRVTIFGAVFFLIALGWILGEVYRSSYVTEAGIVREQPIPFSHKHHVGDEGFDCRYCHTTVETSPVAGIPATEICMNCHSHIWRESPMLEPVRESYRTGKPLRWTRVHDVPDYVYFDHSIHIHKGIGCVSCHGRVDTMPLMWRESSLLMEWCVACHRAPERHVRPREHVFDMAWTPQEDQLTLGARLVKEYDIKSKTSCSTCHR